MGAAANHTFLAHPPLTKVSLSSLVSSIRTVSLHCCNLVLRPQTHSHLSILQLSYHLDPQLGDIYWNNRCVLPRGSCLSAAVESNAHSSQTSTALRRLNFVFLHTVDSGYSLSIRFSSFVDQKFAIQFFLNGTSICTAPSPSNSPDTYSASPSPANFTRAPACVDTETWWSALSHPGVISCGKSLLVGRGYLVYI